MKHFTVPKREEVTPANQAIFDTLHKALGFVPNLYATIGYSSNGLARYLAYQNAKTTLSNKEKEAVNLIVSQVNGCVYCQSAHTAALAQHELLVSYLKIFLITASRLKTEQQPQVVEMIENNKEPFILQRLKDAIEANFKVKHSPADYAGMLYISPKSLAKITYEDEYYFSRFFKVNTDVSPQMYRDTVGQGRGAG